MYFKFFSSCIPVKGWKRSLIVDLQNNLVQILPSDFFEIVNSTLSIEELKDKYNTDKGLDNLLNFLKEKGLIFFTNDLSLFPNLNLEWKYPFLITNVVIEINKFNLHEYNEIQHKINELGGVLACSIRVNFIDNQDLVAFLNTLKELNVRQINLDFLNFINIYSEVKKLIDESRNIYTINIYQSDKIYKEDKINYLDINLKLKNIDVTNDLTINMPHFTESQCHNTCLNRKISIDADGNIKNCPYMQQSYGHIKNTSLIDVVRQSEFRKWWYYRKDDIDVCQDCEFRHICTDCRAFIKDPNNIYSQPAKCGYNPYIALWEGQDNWISVEQWRNENPNWETQAKENRKSYQIEDSEENLKEELEYFNQL